MPGLPLTTDAFILLRKPAASDAFEQLTAFSAEHGALLCLQRIAGRSAANRAVLDLFDEARLILESSSQGRTWFLKEARLLARPAGIGRAYENLRLASAFTALLARNPVHEESRAKVAALLRPTLAAFAASGRPDVVYFKALYCFARDEGYPVREHWWRELAPADRAAAAGLLNRPLADQTLPAAGAARLLHRLEDYLRAHTEILLD